jgi:flagellar motor switch/type III secretory pathway protein FliN
VRIPTGRRSCLSEAWSNLTPVTFSVNDFESNPQLVQIVPPNETVVVVGFELKMGNRAGTMSLCIPYNVIEPIMGVLAAQNWFSYQRKGGQEDHVRKLTRNVNNAPVEMRAFLAQTTIRLQELLSLQVGDLITTDKPIERDVLIQVEGRNRSRARWGSCGAISRCSYAHLQRAGGAGGARGLRGAQRRRTATPRNEKSHGRGRGRVDHCRSLELAGGIRDSREDGDVSALNTPAARW